MLIEPGTPEFDRMFKNIDLHGQFNSLGPSYATLTAAVADPSLDPFEAVNTDLLGYQGVTDLKTGTMRMAQQVMLPTAGLDGGTFGFLESSTMALEKIMEFQNVPKLLDDRGVYKALGLPTAGTDPKKALADVAFAVGMTALGSMGPVGAAAAAIIGFGRMIVQVFKSKATLAKEEKEAALRAAYRSFPPMQQAKEQIDTDIVNQKLLPMLQGGDWTKVFSPRFKGSKWQAIPRLGGYALAMGEHVDGWTNPLGEPMRKFVPTGGIGYWPGQNRITSVIQVSLDPTSRPVKAYLDEHSTPLDYLIEQWMIRDVGDFLVNTTRLASIAWDWVANFDNSPHLYKVSVPKLHAVWSDYCRKGFEALVSRNKDQRTEENFYMSAIGCAVSSWQCWFDEGRYKHINGRLHGRDMGDKGKAGPKTWHPNRGPKQGCVIAPGEGNVGTPLCLGNIYDLQTKLVLDQVADRQRWYLRHSLLCAYVRSSWAAFQGPENRALRDLLDEMRMLLLEHPDRRYVVLEDVPPDEKLIDGRNLKETLIRRGAGKKQIGFKLATSSGTLEPPDKPAPGVSPGGRMPFSDEFVLPPVEDDTRPPWWKDRRIIGAGLGVAIGGAFLWNRRSNSK